MIIVQDLTWIDVKSAGNIPESALDWLDDDQSLTEKLKQKFKNFSVKVLSQVQIYPHKNESRMIDFYGDCVAREVELWGDGKAVIFARSIIPITNDTKKLLLIGSKPLGEVLFDNPQITREAFQITHTGRVWGRRSTFTVGTTKLLVSEFFLEGL